MVAGTLTTLVSRSTAWLTASTRAHLSLVAAGFVVLGIVFYGLIDYGRVLAKRQKLPPGPFPLPFVGNHFQIKLPRPWLWLDALSKQYDSSMITIWHGHKPSIFIHDAWTISDMLEKRANIYSSRPPLVMLGDSRGATEYDQAVLAYGDVWRQHRRLMHTAVGTQAVRAYRPLQDKEIKVMMRDLLSQPDNFVKAIERYSVSVVSCIGFGRRIDKMDDNVGQVALKFMEGVDLVIPGMFLMESMPILLQLPRMIYPLSAKSLGNGKKMIQFFSALCKEAGMSTQDNFAKGLLRAQQQNGLRDEEIAFLTGNLIGGGVDTTASTTITFIFAMCVFSDVQKKAQEELDRVVGDRMPDWQDEARLSYIRALVDETLRWRTVTILGGIPHANTEEDVFGDYVIPKDTWIAGNIWSIHRNPTDFPEPDIFRPERFLNEKKPFPSKKGHAAFGWGRRACSGQPLAEQGLFMTFARLLWAFDLRPGLDENGIEQKLDIFAFTESENMRPEPFRVRISPRTEQKKALILEEAAHARDQLREFDGITKVELEPLEI